MSDRIPIQLRLEGKVKWLTKDRSDSEQSLSAKILVDWTETLLQDLKVTYPNGSHINSRDLLDMLALHHNILVGQPD